MAETSVVPQFEEPYVLVRLTKSEEDSYDVEFEHSGFTSREDAMAFLKEVIENGEDA